ncbi:hypothetical protein DFJ73DRAFT_796001 [Zopfochytrium polystomum]|nr:hypothetical protein DFJ73DRAFT_796001 [Zopfochytrium polystomum]
MTSHSPRPPSPPAAAGGREGGEGAEGGGRGGRGVPPPPTTAVAPAASSSPSSSSSSPLASELPQPPPSAQAPAASSTSNLPPPALPTDASGDNPAPQQRRPEGRLERQQERRQQQQQQQQNEQRHNRSGVRVGAPPYNRNYTVYTKKDLPPALQAEAPWYEKGWLTLTIVGIAMACVSTAFAIVVWKTRPGPPPPVELSPVPSLNHTTSIYAYITDVDGRALHQTFINSISANMTIQRIDVNKLSVPVTNTTFSSAQRRIDGCPQFNQDVFIVGDLFLHWDRFLSNGSRLAVCNMSIAIPDALRSVQYVQSPSFTNVTLGLAAMRSFPTSTSITIFTLDNQTKALLQFTFSPDSLTLTLTDTFTTTPNNGPNDFKILIPPPSSSSRTNLVAVVWYSLPQLRIEIFDFVPDTGRTPADLALRPYIPFTGTATLAYGLTFLALAPPYLYVYYGASLGILALTPSRLPPGATSAYSPINSWYPVALLDDPPPSQQSALDTVDGVLWLSNTAAHVVVSYPNGAGETRVGVFELVLDGSGLLGRKWNQRVAVGVSTAWSGVFSQGRGVWGIQDTGSPLLFSVVY